MLSSLHNQTRHLLWVVAILSPIQAMQDSHILCKLTHRGRSQLANGVCDANCPHRCCAQHCHRSSCPLANIANGGRQESEQAPKPASPCHCPPGSTCCQSSQPQTETVRCRVAEDDNAVIACTIDAVVDHPRPALAAVSIARASDSTTRSLDVCATLCRFTI
jgi:hypothetical protein